MRFVVAGDDFEAEVFDHSEVEFGRLAFRRQVSVRIPAQTDGTVCSDFRIDCCAR